MHGMREKLPQKGTVMQKSPTAQGQHGKDPLHAKAPSGDAGRGLGNFGKIKTLPEYRQRIYQPRESDSPLKRDPKGRNQTALSTLLERRHLVQAYTWQGVPLTTALTRFTLGFQARLERLWEWETLIPKVTPLPQKSHFAIHCTSHPDNSLNSCVSFERLDIIAKIEEKSKSFFSLFSFYFSVDILLHSGIMKDSL